MPPDAIHPDTTIENDGHGEEGRKCEEKRPRELTPAENSSRSFRQVAPLPGADYATACSRGNSRKTNVSRSGVSRSFLLQLTLPSPHRFAISVVVAR